MRLRFKNGGQPLDLLPRLIETATKLIAWWDKCPQTCNELKVPPKDQLQREVAQYQRALEHLQQSIKRKGQGANTSKHGEETSKRQNADNQAGPSKERVR